MSSVEHLTWLRQHGFNPGYPPLSRAAYALRAAQIATLEHRIERQHARVTHADTRRESERAERRLEWLEQQRDALEAEQEILDDLALDWPYLCASCATPIPRESSNYGAGRCAACLRGGAGS